ncbi:hypothetical protein [Phaeobacter italicus]|uniref:hypothetical protein n=1 Tax=Phaeobacter italicus TaxID=481446 RepID=UPI00248DD0BC|nr:hypothetical protein [Phaeobacter italicus]
MTLTASSTAPAASRGGATVGLLSDLPPLEAAAVRAMRHWFAGNEARMSLRADCVAALGPTLGRQAYETLGRFLNFCAAEGRRPLVRHGLSCNCLGADENCLANLVAAANDAAFDDAQMLASLVVSPRQAPRAATMAAKAALVLDQMARDQNSQGAPAATHTTADTKQPANSPAFPRQILSARLH